MSDRSQNTLTNLENTNQVFNPGNAKYVYKLKKVKTPAGSTEIAQIVWKRQLGS